MKANRTRDVWCFIRPAGVSGGGAMFSWRAAEGWTVWVREIHDYGRPQYVVCARMWGQRVAVGHDVYEWTGPHYTTSPREIQATLYAARIRACELVLVLSGSMSAEGLARRCGRGRYYRDGKRTDYMVCPWRWESDPFVSDPLTAGPRTGKV